jgi:Fe-S-cluster containining protein
MNTNKTHDDLVADWKAKAEKHDERNYRFLRNLRQQSFEKVDRIALELHQEAFNIVDCTRCANCCRTMRIGVTEEDIPRIAKHLGMAPEEFVVAYLEPDKEAGGYRMKMIPCPFLGDDNLCTIYDVRPGGCRAYPYTDKPYFSSRSIANSQSAVICPAVFYIVEQMKRRTGRHQENHHEVESEKETAMSTHLWKRSDERRFGNSRLVDFLKDHGASVWNQPVMEVSASAFRAALENAKELGLTKDDIAFIKKELKGADDDDFIDSYDISGLDIAEQ